MSTYVERRTRRANAPAKVLYRVVCGVGGERGWYSPSWLWELRGFLDRLIGGPGMGRKRRDPDLLEIGDTIGFWRVTHLAEPNHVYLVAEMKVPGVAALEFEVESDEAEGPGSCASFLTHTAKFEPGGLLGHAYWWLLVPMHRYVFGAMIKGMVEAAENEHRKSEPESLSGS